MVLTSFLRRRSSSTPGKEAKKVDITVHHHDVISSDVVEKLDNFLHDLGHECLSHKAEEQRRELLNQVIISVNFYTVTAQII